MKKILAVMALSAIVPFSAPAQASDFPKWPVSATCKPGDGSCAQFEVFARGQISGTWDTLPPKARAQCVAETGGVEKSYRLLQFCLSNAMQELLKGQQRNPEGGEVVQLTPKAKTPEPAPAPTPAPAPAAAPAPAPAEPAAPAAAPEATKPQ